MNSSPLIDGWMQPPVKQVNRPSPTTVNNTPMPGGGVIPGADPNVLSQLSGLTQQQIAAAQAGLTAQNQIGTAQVQLDQENLQFNQEYGNILIDRESENAKDAVVNNAVQRGIYNSGIRVGGEREVAEAQSESKMLLGRDVALGLQNLQMRLAQLSADYNLGLATSAYTYTMQDLGYAQSLIEAGGGMSAGMSSGTGNTDPTNISAAKAGIGPYGTRVQIATQYGNMLASQFGLSADGVGYFRPASESSGGGRSENSDHITGGAVDFMLDPADPTQRASGEAMITELNKLMAQGIVSGYIWNPDNPSDAHYGHIHVSFALPGGTSNVTGAYYTSGYGATEAAPIIPSSTQTSAPSSKATIV